MRLNKDTMFNNNRILHSLGVARKMKELATSLYPKDKEFIQDMFVLGMMHDIGYEFAPMNHAAKGGDILERNKYKYWKEVAWHGNPNSLYSSAALRILNTADMQIDNQGNETTVEERLNGIRERYGKDSRAYNDCKKLVSSNTLVLPLKK